MSDSPLIAVATDTNQLTADAVQIHRALISCKSVVGLGVFFSGEFKARRQGGPYIEWTAIGRSQEDCWFDSSDLETSLRSVPPGTILRLVWRVQFPTNPELPRYFAIQTNPRENRPEYMNQITETIFIDPGPDRYSPTRFDLDATESISRSRQLLATLIDQIVALTNGPIVRMTGMNIYFFNGGELRPEDSWLFYSRDASEYPSPDILGPNTKSVPCENGHVLLYTTDGPYGHLRK